MRRVARALARQVATMTAPLSMPGQGQDGRLDEDDVGHGHEGGRPAEELAADGRPVLAEPEGPFERSPSCLSPAPFALGGRRTSVADEGADLDLRMGLADRLDALQERQLDDGPEADDLALEEPDEVDGADRGRAGGDEVVDDEDALARGPRRPRASRSARRRTRSGPRRDAHLRGSLPFFRMTARPSRSSRARAAAKRKPRDSIPAMISGCRVAAQAASSSMAALKAWELWTTGVMSLKTMPGLGKSGTSTMNDLRSMLMAGPTLSKRSVY